MQSSSPPRPRRVSRSGRALLSRRLTLERLEDRCLLAPVAVTNTLDVVNGDTTSINALVGDDGEDGISLREAILAANATGGADTINFSIPTSDSGYDGVTGVWTIQPTSQLPSITEAVEFNGYSQSGASVNTLDNGINAVLTIELDGSLAGIGAHGLHITGGGSTISGLAINRFNSHGIQLEGSGGSTVSGNFLGTDASGTQALGNDDGVDIVDSIDNTIGGGSPAARNLISGNLDVGVQISHEVSTGNMIQGNFIGTDVTGANALGNVLDGVRISAVVGQDTYATDNLVGGTAAGEGNLISGNGGNGVRIFRGTLNRVEGNLIGTDVLGNSSLANGISGVRIAEGADNVIGGTDPFAGNVISGNTAYGVEIRAGEPEAGPINAVGNKVQGNLIGTDRFGENPVANLSGGVYMHTTLGSTVQVIDNTIGGTTESARNVISGNGIGGVVMLTPLVTNNKVQGNYIGTDVDGTDPIANSGSGVLLTKAMGIDGAPFGNIIGGTEPGAGNVISANSGDGITFTFAASSNSVQGNFIGITADGLQGLGNTQSGVSIEGGFGNFVGGLDGDDGDEDMVVNARNVISGNGGQGVWIVRDADSTNATGNVVLGNYIGTNRDGTAAIPNTNGVFVEDVSLNFIGKVEGPIPNDINDGGNLISGNAGWGVVVVGIAGPLATLNRVDGNRIGTNAAADSAIANGVGGVLIQNAPSNFIGDPSAYGGNIIGGAGAGVFILGSDAQLNVLANNWIGYAGLNGGTPVLLPNTTGVLIQDAPNNTVGGAGAGFRNVISGNTGSGVHIKDGFASGNQVLGNYIGIDENGMVAAANTYGVSIDDAGNNVIGGAQADAGNVLSGNVLAGVLIEGLIGDDNKVQGNLIGLSADGTTAVPNGTGVAIADGASRTIVGTDGDGTTDAQERNVISGNSGIGVSIFEADLNTVAGNYIGTTIDGTASMGNQHGVVILSVAGGDLTPDNTVGGTTAAMRNVISGNQISGVTLAGVNTDKSVIQGNYIGTAANGQDPLGNLRRGILVDRATDTMIGGSEEGSGNTIAHNGSDLGRMGHGVIIVNGLGNTIRRNSIHSNAGRGIDLGNNTLKDSINDPGDEDSGANNLQNYPVVTNVSFSGGMKMITWELDGVDANEEYTFEFYSNTALDPSGFGEGEKYLDMTVAETESTSGILTVEWSFPASEEWISATVTDPDGNTSEFSMVDTDGDALADAWELFGIDVNEDGVLDLAPLSLKGASHLHKDVFVEIDAMAGLAPSQNALDMVINGRPGKSEGFANVPNSLVNNPDGLDGINLHLEVDGDTDIKRQTWSNLNNDWPVDFDLIKNGGAEDLYPDGRFGTPDERILLNWEHIREARRLVYHYALFADDIPAKPRAGQAEFHGNDFYIALGDWSIQGGTDQDNASTFMHELGHNLGLDHGGGDDINYKPNYYSIMNYIWDDQTTIPENQPGFGEYWRLDYSRAALPTVAPHTLNEAGLSEMAGFGGDPNIFVPIGPLFDVVPRKPDFVPMGGPVDLNGNGLMNETLPRDVTFLSDTNGDGVFSELDASPDQPLVGYNDWSNLRFDFTGQADFKERTHESSESKGFTLEVFELINSLGIGPGVFEFSHEAYDELESSGMATIRVVRAGGTDGAATVEYSVAADTATAGDDFTVVSGVLQFADGEFQKTFVIPIVDEGEFELAETIILTLENPTGGATLGGRDAAVLEIVNDDAPPLIGDYNGNGAVDAADYTVWRNTLGPAAVSPYSGADGDGDGNVTRDDYLLWKSQYGQTLPPAVGNGAAQSASVAAVNLSDPSIESSTAEATAAAANPSPNALRPVSTAIPESRTPVQATTERIGQRPVRAHVTDASDDLLLLAIDRVRHASKRELAVAVDGEDSPVEDREIVRPFDEPHAAALATWR